jgi:cysteine-rich repeat protein
VSTRRGATLAALSALALAASLAPACGGKGGTGGGGTGGTGGAYEGRCGDGSVDPGEECDDGNADDTDDCTSTCHVARCGDGIVQPGEECDDGNYDDTDACVSGCVLATCGDGYVQAGVEECDDGNQEDGDACSSTCKAGAGCGNGVVEAGEECDDGNQSNADACLNTCKNATCGDGYAHLGVEECDDGNTDDTDFCSNTCKVNVPMTYGCPGIALTVALAGDTTVTGDTTPAMDTAKGSCGGDGAAEIVYKVTAQDSGTLIVTMTGVDGGDPVLYARAADCAGGMELGCSDNTFAGGVESILFPVTAGSDYFIFADAYTGTTAKFSLDLHLQTAAPGDTCPGIPVAVDTASDVTLTGNTAAAGAHYKGTGNCSTSASTKDVVYAVTPAANGTLYVTMDPTYDGQIYARSGSCTTGTQIACAEAAGVGGLETMSFPVMAGTKYSVFADGKNGSAGSYTIQFHLGP